MLVIDHVVLSSASTLNPFGKKNYFVGSNFLPDIMAAFAVDLESFNPLSFSTLVGLKQPYSFQSKQPRQDYFAFLQRGLHTYQPRLPFFYARIMA